jgi:hypothetical protein
MRLTTYPERVGTSVVGAGRGLLRSWFLLVGDRRIVLYAGSTVSGVKRFRILLTGDQSPVGPAVALDGGREPVSAGSSSRRLDTRSPAAIPSHVARGSPDLASVSAPLSPCIPRVESQSRPVGLCRHPSAAGVGLVVRLRQRPGTHLRRNQVVKEPLWLFAARPPI